MDRDADPSPRIALTRERPRAVLLDLLMAVMNSLDSWTVAAGDRDRGLAWRDGVTRRMTEAGRYQPYDALVAEAAAEAGLGRQAPERLRRAWLDMEPWPDAAALARLPVPCGFVTNSSSELAAIASERSRRAPRFVLSAEDAGWYKPHPAIYHVACRRIGLSPAATLFVAGSPYDAAGAHAAGLRAVLVPRRSDHHAPEGVAVARSLDEVVDRFVEQTPGLGLGPGW